ncbi:MAG: protein translocase subunit secF [Nocardioidaceae bacterium]|nr:protein translocase subunit secF [Nocardioidaceae bacterium]
MGRFSRLGNALYEGDVSVDFVGRKWLWYFISGVIVLLAIGGLVFRGLDLGIEFKGGAEYTIPVSTAKANQDTVDTVRNAVSGSGIEAAASPVVNLTGGNSVTGSPSIRVQTESIDNDLSDQLITVMAKSAGVSANTISESAVGPSYGSQVAKQALTGLIVFLILVVLFIWAYFREWKMSVAALVALAHDVVITVGVYALSGFEVTPATVTGLLTILGFSLYDTVVVFDKIRENTRNLRASRTTYAAAANLAVNQTLVRSINTSIVALLPVAAILYVSITTLGSGDLKDLSLALFVGMLSGAYSSIFIATPLLVQLKSGEKDIADAERRVNARQRRDADRYASVPVFSEDMPLTPEPDDRARDMDDVDVDIEPVSTPAPAPRPAPRRPTESGTGRTVPTPKAPVTESRSSGRNQPKHQPRSKRGKST